MASDAGMADTFRLRRGEVKRGGDVNRRVRWDPVLERHLAPGLYRSSSGA